MEVTERPPTRVCLPATVPCTAAGHPTPWENFRGCTRRSSRACCDEIKVAGNTHLGTHSLQLRSLDRPMLQAQPDLIQSARILAKAMIGSFGRFDLLLEIGRQFDLQPARQRSFPGNELPLLTTLAVFAAMYERAFDLDLGSQQMLPLIPGAVPECMQDGRIKPQLQLAAHVAAKCPVIVEITFPQWHMEPPAPQIW